MSCLANFRVPASTHHIPHHYLPRHAAMPARHPVLRPRELKMACLAPAVIPHATYGTWASHNRTPPKAIQLTRQNQELKRIQQVVLEARDFSPLASFSKAGNIFMREELKTAWSGILKKQLERAYLEEIDFSPVSFNAFCQAVKSKHQLTALILHRVYVDSQFDVKNLEALLNSLDEHPSITHLELCHSHLDDTHAEVIAQAFFNGRLKNITHLSLSGNDIGNAGALRIYQAMSALKNPNRRELDLSINFLDLKGLDNIQKERKSQPIKSRLTVHLHGNNHKWAS